MAAYGHKRSTLPARLLSGLAPTRTAHRISAPAQPRTQSGNSRCDLVVAHALQAVVQRVAFEGCAAVHVRRRTLFRLRCLRRRSIWFKSKAVRSCFLQPMHVSERLLHCLQSGPIEPSARHHAHRPPASVTGSASAGTAWHGQLRSIPCTKMVSSLTLAARNSASLCFISSFPSARSVHVRHASMSSSGHAPDRARVFFASADFHVASSLFCGMAPRQKSIKILGPGRSPWQSNPKGCTIARSSLRRTRLMHSWPSCVGLSLHVPQSTLHASSVSPWYA